MGVFLKDLSHADLCSAIETINPELIFEFSARLCRGDEQITSDPHSRKENKSCLGTLCEPKVSRMSEFPPSSASLRLEYSRFFASLTPENKAFARENGLHKPMPERGFSIISGGEDALDQAEDYEPIPESEQRGTKKGSGGRASPIVFVRNPAIDAIEPEEAADLRNFTPAQIQAAADDFTFALEWALSGGAVIRVAQRTAVLFAFMRPVLTRGIEVCQAEAKALLRYFGGGMRIAVKRLRAAGLFYGRVLQWVRETNDFAAIGERLQFIAYEFCPSLIDAATNAKLAACKNKTRQAANRVANHLRDTFAGQKALVMRGYETRRRCRDAQLCAV